MIRFDLIDVSKENGWMKLHSPLDCETKGVTLKRDNPWWRFCDVKLGRTVEFSVPATDHNKRLLLHGEDPAEYGEALRIKIEAQMVYEGGCVKGMLEVTGYKGDAFTCVFREGDSQWLDDLQGRKLADCPSTLKGIVWSQSTTVQDADTASGDLGLVLYDNGHGYIPNWQLMPSAKISSVISDYLTNLGIDDTQILSVYPSDLWLIAASLKANGQATVTVTAAAGDGGMTVNQPTLFQVEPITVEWATAMMFGQYVGGGSVSAYGFRALKTMQAVFPQGFPNDVYLISWDSRLRRCKCLGSDLATKTIDMAAGDVFFFASYSGEYLSSGAFYGWQETYATTSGYTLNFEVAQDVDMTYGDTWSWLYNVPDMTLFDFLKAAARVAGLELNVDAVAKTITMEQASYGYDGNQKPDVRQLENVIAVEEVRRCVDVWGAGTRTAKVVFDSEDYVENPIVTEYGIDNEQLSSVKDTKIPWSEGAAGDNGVLVNDVSYDGTTAKLAAKKMTVALATAGSHYLQRVTQPQMRGYDDISMNSTTVRIKAAYPVGELVSLLPRTTYVWRGVMYVWTEATWTGGVLSLTLQKVSQIQPK